MGKCGCVIHHQPPAVVIEKHHILPLSWGGIDDPANIIEICAQTHFTVHYILNQFVRAKSQTPIGHLPRYAYNLAFRAWRERDPAKPTPFWMPEHPPLHDIRSVSEFMGWTD